MSEQSESNERFRIFSYRGYEIQAYSGSDESNIGIINHTLQTIRTSNFPDDVIHEIENMSPTEFLSCITNFTIKK